MTKVCVFGGAGFLGSHVADALSDQGYAVRIFDRQDSRWRRDDQEITLGEITDRKAVIDAAQGCDHIYNFAAIADIDEAKAHPVETAEINILGHLHTLEAARLASAKRFVFSSSVYVYSQAGSFYRVSKQAAERFVEAYQEQYGLDYTIVRYGSLYGRRADARNSIYRFLKQALEEQTLCYKGDPESVREYIHVNDAARLSVGILAEEWKNKHVILTGQEKMTVARMMAMIAEMLPDPIPISFSRTMDDIHYVMTPYSFQPTLGQKLIGNSYVDLGQGLLDCMAEMHDAIHSHGERHDDWLIEKSRAVE